MVTLLLFGAYAYSIRLPFKMTSPYGIRYRQVLSENFPQFFDDVPIPESLEWERPNDMDPEKWSAPIKARLERIHDEGAQQAVRARCERAYKRAVELTSNFGDIWTRYAASLGLECFRSDEVDTIIRIGRQLNSQDRLVWEIPVTSMNADVS